MGPLHKRIVAALVLIPVVVGAVLWLPGGGFALVLGAFAVAGAVEWRRVGALPSGAGVAFVGLVALSLLGCYLGRSSASLIGTVLIAALLWWALVLGWVLTWQRAAPAPGLHLTAVRFAAGWLVLVPTFVALVRLHQERPALVLYLLVLIWVADSAAFFAGRRFGRRKLASRVSPGKTWEGVAAGLAGVAALGLGVAATGLPGAGGALVFVLLSLLAGAAGVLGDLAESLFKRRAGVKDSGTVIPGHGGVLDRIDSVTAAGPCFASGWLAAGMTA